ncbi:MULTISPECIES: alpha/beta fold hydrolase [unclassified Coleofasciculus]|uniref:alpha/beta fold hydrolase n=1 Tax=unclassified Coleofasciculus TaxID=2692782 RepID=UPI00187FBBE7|nr:MULTISPECIES: alpha/beta hydrolase [unclassified Coleofasciculus]MBE9126015.1 alpha/beta hydrolase [Coleofasciculus sp. LEGE 07081]MBE9149390.1 alpha/beta hydrolase [Coleofasciculus sp. LEGE 07092]
MPTTPDVLWLNVSPSLQRFDQPLIRYLSRQVAIAQWDYQQSQDEPSSVDVPVVLLHDYLKSCDRPIHLIGHGTGGLVGLLYARKYPERVKSLTLLAVGVHPAIDWQAHYYVQLQLLRCSRQMVLTQMVYNLFGDQDRYATRGLIKILEQDLKRSPSPHSLFKRVSLPPGGVPVPLMVCGSRDDIVVDPNELQGWLPWFKESDRLWQCIDGGHFFHNYHPQSVGEQVFDFWQSVGSPSVMPSSLGRC